MRPKQPCRIKPWNEIEADVFGHSSKYSLDVANREEAVSGASWFYSETPYHVQLSALEPLVIYVANGTEAVSRGHYSASF